MKTKKLLTALSLLSFFSLLGCANVFESMADKTSDEAILEDARKKMNDGEWSSALEKFASLTDSTKSKPDVIEQWATAYAGKCGLDFIAYFGDLSEASLTGSTIFKYLMNAWTGDVVDPASCTLAHDKMEESSVNPSERSSDQNLFMAVLGMVKIGVYLRTNLDVDGTGNLGDNTAEKNPCSTTDLSDANLNEVVTGLGLVTTNLTYLTNVLPAGSVTSALSDLDTICDSFGSACGRTDPATVTSSDRDAFRDLLKTNSSNTTAPVGVGDCSDALVAPCC